MSEKDSIKKLLTSLNSIDKRAFKKAHKSHVRSGWYKLFENNGSGGTAKDRHELKRRLLIFLTPTDSLGLAKKLMSMGISDLAVKQAVGQLADAEKKENWGQVREIALILGKSDSFSSNLLFRANENLEYLLRNERLEAEVRTYPAGDSTISECLSGVEQKPDLGIRALHSWHSVRRLGFHRLRMRKEAEVEAQKVVEIAKSNPVIFSAEELEEMIGTWALMAFQINPEKGKQICFSLGLTSLPDKIFQGLYNLNLHQTLIGDQESAKWIWSNMYRLKPARTREQALVNLFSKGATVLWLRHDLWLHSKTVSSSSGLGPFWKDYSLYSYIWEFLGAYDFGEWDKLDLILRRIKRCEFPGPLKPMVLFWLRQIIKSKKAFPAMEKAFSEQQFSKNEMNFCDLILWARTRSESLWVPVHRSIRTIKSHRAAQ